MTHKIKSFEDLQLAAAAAKVNRLKWPYVSLPPDEQHEAIAAHRRLMGLDRSPPHCPSCTCSTEDAAK